MAQAPQFSYVCPLVWHEMSGDETSRYCDTCHRTVPNLSLMSDSDRESLLERAQTESVCAAFYQTLTGELVTLSDIVRKPGRYKIRGAGVSVVAATALSLLSGCVTETGVEIRSQPEIPLRDPTVQVGSADDTEVITLVPFGMICAVPQEQGMKGPASKR